MPNSLPADTIEMERAIASAIASAISAVEHVGHVHDEPQYISTPEEELALALVNDPVMGSKRPFRNIIEVGLPTVEETDGVGGGSDEEFTGLYFTYPISFSLGVVPKWEKAGFPYTTSAQMAIGIYLKARKLLKQDRALGFITNRVTHFYLQLVGQGELTNDEGEALEHLQDWELRVKVEGKY